MEKVKESEIAEQKSPINKRKKLKGYAGLLWILPGFVLLLIFSYYPAVSSFFYSMTDWNAKLYSFIWFDNFKELFRDTIFLKSIGTALLLTCTGIVIGNVATILLAELLFNLRSPRLGGVYRFLFVLPCLVPGIVTMLFCDVDDYTHSDSDESVSITNLAIQFEGVPEIAYNHLKLLNGGYTVSLFRAQERTENLLGAYLEVSSNHSAYFTFTSAQIQNHVP